MIYTYRHPIGFTSCVDPGPLSGRETFLLSKDPSCFVIGECLGIRRFRLLIWIVLHVNKNCWDAIEKEDLHSSLINFSKGINTNRLLWSLQLADSNIARSENTQSWFEPSQIECVAGNGSCSHRVSFGLFCHLNLYRPRASFLQHSSTAFSISQPLRCIIDVTAKIQ